MNLMIPVLKETDQPRLRPQPQPDEGLFADMAKGSTAALETLYAQTSSAVYGFALSILKNAQDAEDVMQDTYVTLFNKASSYRPAGKPMAWVLTIVRNLALMKLRRSGGQTPLPQEPALPTFEGNSLDRLVLQAALVRLGQQESQIVMLYCVAGLKHREIGEVLGLPLGTVLSKYRRALSKLQKALQEEAS